jgi:hypothetical protein
VIETWDLTGLPSFSSGSGISTLFPATGVQLASGQQYWLVGASGHQTTYAIWNFAGTEGSIGLAAQ